MKIALLSRHQQSINRGAEVFVEELSSRLNQAHEVVVLSGKKADSLREIIKGEFDVVVPINGRMQVLKVLIGRFFSNYKVVISGHSGIGRDDLWNIIVGNPEIFVCLTDYMMKNSKLRIAKELSGLCEFKKIPNGVDLVKFSPEGARISIDLPGKIVLSVGALVWYKHHEKTIRAVSKLNDVSLLIIGKGLLKKGLEKLADELIPGRYRIIDVDYEEMPKYYRSADLFVLPSWEREAFGIAYLEAMASNLAVVAPDDLARREIVGDGGVFVDVSDSTSYSEKIITALQSDWGDKPRKQAEKFDWEVVASEYNKLFLSLR